MEARAIPGTDLRISALAFGGWLTLGDRLSEAESVRLLAVAREAGINFFDLADVYAGGGAERVVGNFVRAVGRDGLVISSKVFWPTSEREEDRGLSRRHIHAAIDGTLQRLGIDCLDLYFCHREDAEVPLAETVAAMGDLVRAGKIRAWGTSCWRPSTLHAAHALAAQIGCAPPRVEQPRYNLLVRAIERDVLPTCQQLGMAVVAWSPLAGGVLTGKYLAGVAAGSRAAVSSWNDEYLRPPQRAAVAAFVEACRARGLAPAAVALAWVLRRPGLTAAICGATNEQQLRANLDAAAIDFGSAGTAWIEQHFPVAGRGVLARVRSLLARLRGR